MAISKARHSHSRFLYCLNLGFARITQMTRIGNRTSASSAKRRVFCSTATSAGVLALRRCLPVVLRCVAVQSRQCLNMSYEITL